MRPRPLTRYGGSLGTLCRREASVKHKMCGGSGRRRSPYRGFVCGQYRALLDQGGNPVRPIKPCREVEETSAFQPGLKTLSTGAQHSLLRRSPQLKERPTEGRDILRGSVPILGGSRSGSPVGTRTLLCRCVECKPWVMVNVRVPRTRIP